MRHMDFLRSKYILSEDDCEEINGLPVRKRRASKFLDILCKKGPQAYDMFCRSLEYERTQIFILKELNQEYEKRIRNYRGGYALLLDLGRVEGLLALHFAEQLWTAYNGCF